MDRCLSHWFARYAARGWFIFPVRTDTKMPAISGNLERASIDLAQLERWAAKFPGCNWGVSLAKSGLVAVDVDAKGLGVWEGLIAHEGEPPTLKAKSGSGIGCHYIFKARKGAVYRGKMELPDRTKVEGVDVKWNGFVVVEPSVHKSGGLYEWESFADAPLDMPGWLATLCEKPAEVAERKKAKRANAADVKFYANLVRQLKEKELSYDRWIRCGMSLFSAFEGDDTGLDLWVDLSNGVSHKPGDDPEAKWLTFSPNGSITSATIGHIARELGCDVPNPSMDADRLAFARNAEQRRKAESGVEWFDDSGRRCTTRAETAIKYFNDAGFAVMTRANAGMIARYSEEDGVKRVQMMDPRSFHTVTKDRFFKFYDFNGVPKYRQASELWLEHIGRKTFSEIVFRPRAEPGQLNLWSDIPCKAEPGDVSLILALVERVICSGDTERAEYLLDWCARLMQKPWQKCPVVPVLIGEQGTGKGLFTDGILGGILKSFYVRLDKPGQIVERFNVEQARKFLTVLDESCWQGYHELANVMKSLTGNDTMTVEEKFGGRYSLENYSAYCVTSNTIEAVKVERSNRRYFILEVSSVALGSGMYARLWDSVRSGEACRAFYAYLMSRDVSKFDPFKFPAAIDTGGSETKVSSLCPVGQFWHEILCDTPRRLFRDTGGGALALVKERAWSEFAEFAKHVRGRKLYTRHSFWGETRRLMSALDWGTEQRGGSDGGRERRLPFNPDAMRKEFCQRNRIATPGEFDRAEYTLDGQGVGAGDF